MDMVCNLFASAAAIVVTLVAARASAFIKDCHTRMTTDVLEDAAWPLGSEPPPLTGDYAHLVMEVSIDVAPAVQNLWALSVLIGNQLTDQGPYRRDDIASVAQLNALPDLQREHCLRGTGDDGPAGDATALMSCKVFILQQLEAALGPGEEPDLDATEVVEMYLTFRGSADVPLPRFAYHLGRAVHALQDSFSHTFRSPDLAQVRSVLNWVDWLQPTYVEERDGFQHLIALDRCGASDPGGMERREAARHATFDLVNAVANDEGGRAGRLARAEGVLDRWLGLEEGCTAANQWCDAPERTQTGCGVAPASRGGSPGKLALLAIAVLAAWRLRRALLVVALVGLAARAEAQDTPPKEDPSRGEVSADVIPKATPAEQRELEARPFSTLVKAGIGIDNGAGALGLGFRYDLGRRLSIGIGADWSPWFSVESQRTTSGTADIFVIGTFRFAVRDYLELRTSLSAGVSILLFDTWAAQRGNVGPYFAISLLGVGIRMNDRLRLLVDPAELVVPIPQTKGIPLVYRQHRLSVALQASF
jgi:MYXO-CTERM domain-containing protein